MLVPACWSVCVHLSLKRGKDDATGVIINSFLYTHTHTHTVFQSPCMPHSWVIPWLSQPVQPVLQRNYRRTEATQWQMLQCYDLIHLLWILKKLQVGFPDKDKVQSQTGLKTFLALSFVQPRTRKFYSCLENSPCKCIKRQQWQ